MLSFQEQLYRSHRERVLNAKSYLYNAPKYDVYKALHTVRLQEDFSAYDRTRRLNNQLLLNMNRIARNVDRKPDVHPIPQSRVPVMINRNRELNKINERFGQLLKNTKTITDARLSPKLLCKLPTKKRSTFSMPTEILAKYSRLNLPSERLLQKLLRPRVYFDFYIKDVRPAGRAQVELFTEACPEVVLAFVRICQKRRKDRIVVNRLFPGLFLNCDLNMEGEQYINPKKIEYDRRALAHDRPGILSFSHRQQDSLTRGILDFVITLKPLSVLSERNVAFGRLLNDVGILECMEEYGIQKTGKLIRKIELSDVGLVY